MCSPEKYWMKIPYNKKIFYLNEKEIYNKNISYWKKIYFNWLTIYFHIIKKNDIMKIYILLNTKLFWLNKNIFWYHEKRVL